MAFTATTRHVELLSVSKCMLIDRDGCQELGISRGNLVELLFGLRVNKKAAYAVLQKPAVSALLLQTAAPSLLSPGSSSSSTAAPSSSGIYLGHAIPVAAALCDKVTLSSSQWDMIQCRVLDKLRDAAAAAAATPSHTMENAELALVPAATPLAKHPAALAAKTFWSAHAPSSVRVLVDFVRWVLKQNPSTTSATHP